jgi:hypothetical protein
MYSFFQSWEATVAQRLSDDEISKNKKKDLGFTHQQSGQPLKIAPAYYENEQ